VGEAAAPAGAVRLHAAVVDRRLEDNGVAILANATRHGARIDVVNIMTFDYYDDQPHEMAADTKTAAAGLHRELHQL